jgi:hypothetical protein
VIGLGSRDNALAVERREPSRPVARRRWPWILAGAALLILVLVTAAVVRLVQAERHLVSARRSMLRAEADVRSANVRGAVTELSGAESEITAATNLLYGSREVTLMGVLPVVHQNLQALRSSVALVFTMANGAKGVLETAGPLVGADGRLGVPLRNGALPLGAVTTAARQLDDLATQMPGAANTPKTRVLLGPVASLQRQVYAEAARRRAQFSSLSRALGLLGDMAGANGPRHYLIAAGNAAEMRGTGGMILSYGLLSGTDGRFTLDKFGPVDQIPLPAPATLPATPDYVTRFAPYGPTQEWRSANLGADFLSVAPVLEAMYNAATRTRVDGVIQVDSMGVAQLLRGLGPVDVPDVGVVTADNVVPLTLNELYVRFPDRAVRQEYLGTVVEAVFRRLVTGDFPDLRALGSGVNQAVRQRDLMFHTSVDADQRAGTQLGADGTLPSTPDFGVLTVQNFSGNKLDYYLNSHLQLSGTRRRGASTVQAQIDLENTAPANGRPSYIFGPFDPTLRNGQYFGLVSLYLPSGTRLVSSSGPAASAPVVTSEDGRTVVSFQQSLDAGGRKTVTLVLQLPPRAPGPYQLVLLSPPRVRPTTVAVDLQVGDERLRRSGTLGAPWVISGTR